MRETKIRLVVSNDADRIAELSGQLGYSAAGDEISERISKMSGREDTVLFVAEEEGVVVGWIQVSVRATIESGGSAEITGLVVDEAVRGKGIGGDLVRKAEAWANEAGHHTLRVRTNVVRADADKFYRGLGFEETKRQTVFRKEV